MTIKVLELVGESTKSWEDATHNAVKDASRTIENIVGIEVVNNTAKIENGTIVEYKTNLNLAFKVDS